MIAGAVVNVKDYGAKGDGSTDDTAAFQAAIAYLETTGTPSSILFLEAKAYRITGTLTITRPILIRGQGIKDFDSARPITRPVGGTWLIHANPTGPLFLFNSSLGVGAGVEDLGIFQEGHSTPGVGWAPAVRDWVIRNEGTQGTLTLRRVHFHNVYRGVTTDNSARPHYEDITGQFFYRGFSYDRIYDLGKLDGFRAWTYWSEHNDVLTWQQANCVGITLLRVDGMFIDRVFTFAQMQTLYVGLSSYGGTARVIFINSLYSDFCGRALVVDAASPAHLQIASMFHLGQAWPASPVATITAGSVAVDVVSGSNHNIQIGNLYSALTTGSAVKVAGTSNQVWISSPILEQYDKSASGVGAFTASATNLIHLAATPSIARYDAATAQIMTGAPGGIVTGQLNKNTTTSEVNTPVTSGAASGQLVPFTVQGEAASGVSLLALTTGIVNLAASTNALSFYGGSSAVKGAVTGAKGGNAALAGLLTYLAARGLLTDSTT